MIIQRYLVREIISTFSATLLVLMLIIVGNTFVRLLGKVSGGNLPIDALSKLVFLGSINGLIKLVPIALLIGMMLAFGRLYRDHEMSAMHSSGIGPKQFYKGIFLFVAPLTLIIAGLTLFVIPDLEKTSYNIKQEIKQRPEASGIPIGEFMHSKTGGKSITLFVEEMDEENVVMKRFFMHLNDKEETAKKTDSIEPSKNTQDKKTEDNIEIIVSAEQALLYVDPKSGNRIVKIENGSRYDNNKSTGEFSIFNFAEHGIHIPALEVNISTDLETEPTLELLKLQSNESNAEIHWRLALILQAPVMALLAFPLSHTTPRQGRFGKLAFGILLYAVYANLIITGKSMIEDGRIPNWLGLWWTHLIFIALSLWLLRKQYGNLK
ncbi:LPS export ABC transporter permease LptF [Cocleimonas flava]|uniref:Lipopolysaccharide export system permease protein LptF n=1 Tax=Cocleimonas flava TaxID=634765 RepID=A0A4R1ETB7_9GAMM|nr:MULTISPECIES: LPS export ABC transporter permease LptF [Cocleimonas]MEB8432545.1 LPS export ABC transporter permease LptF [Cocleimonas sp. KMM 6892]MEC4715404.1 LPS export ABC transporter permease LptF [Cocleimonas sp. KMM 6895]MEC4744977.1 LPS export ABC transporter permease LptF [Cocleimonas sp. KMM 6896]TCJ82979.1 lipopolysaccharide export system permease protein [Cocleimonas flava]